MPLLFLYFLNSEIESDLCSFIILLILELIKLLFNSLSYFLNSEIESDLCSFNKLLILEFIKSLSNLLFESINGCSL